MGTYILKEEQGKWELRDAQNAPFFSLGVNCVTLKDVDVTNGDMYRSQRNWFPKWIYKTWDEIASLGFNTLGAWHHPIFWGGKTPKTVALALSQYAKKVNNVWGMGFPDVFDPSFAVSIQKTLIDTFCGHGDVLADDAGVIGYFTDNELHWWGSGGYWGDNNQTGGSCTGLVDDYIQLSAQCAGKQHWVNFLIQRYETIQQLNSAWQSEYLCFDDLLHLGHYRAVPEILETDKLAFLKCIARRYFEETSSLLRQYAPGSLNLGCRYVGQSTPDVVLETGRDYVDADSFNFYCMEFPERYLDHVYAITGRPIIITEFSFSAGRSAGFLDSNNGSRNVIVFSQARRGDCYHAFAAAAKRKPYMLGLHWFALFDYGNNVHGLIGNYGLYDLNGRAYSEFQEAVKRTHAQL